MHKSMATIIRKDNLRETRSGRPVQTLEFSLEDMRHRADEYLETVRGEAAKIIQHAHQQAEQIRQQAEIAGRKVAEEAAERILDEKVGRRMETLLPALEALIQQINDARGDLQRHWEKNATKVAVTIAERIIRRELTRQPHIKLELISQMLSLAAGSTEITLHLNPTDYENLGPQIKRLAATLCQLAPSEIVPDESITSGGCRVSTKFGQIDGQIEAQLRRIEQDLE